MRAPSQPARICDAVASPTEVSHMSERNADVLLVGSVPLESAHDVFKTCASARGEHLLRGVSFQRGRSSRSSLRDHGRFGWEEPRTGVAVVAIDTLPWFSRDHADLHSLLRERSASEREGISHLHFGTFTERERFRRGLMVLKSKARLGRKWGELKLVGPARAILGVQIVKRLGNLYRIHYDIGSLLSHRQRPRSG